MEKAAVIIVLIVVASLCSLTGIGIVTWAFVIPTIIGIINSKEDTL